MSSSSGDVGQDWTRRASSSTSSTSSSSHHPKHERRRLYRHSRPAATGAQSTAPARSSSLHDQITDEIAVDRDSFLPSSPSRSSMTLPLAAAAAGTAQKGTMPPSVQETGGGDRTKANISPSARRKAPSISFLSLPIFADGDAALDDASSRRNSSSSSVNSSKARRSRAEQLLGPGANISRSHSLRVESTRDSAQTATEGATGVPRPHRSPTLSGSALSRLPDAQAPPPASPRVRRWSSLSRSGTATSALRMAAEGASPYLRAGLDELRSIFDVESDPIPTSPSGSIGSDDDHDPERACQSPTTTRGRRTSRNGPIEPRRSSEDQGQEEDHRRNRSNEDDEQQRHGIVKSVSQRFRRPSFRTEERISLLPTAAHPMGSPTSPLRALPQGAPRLRSPDSAIQMPFSTSDTNLVREHGVRTARSLLPQHKSASNGEKQGQEGEEAQHNAEQHRKSTVSSMSREVLVWGLAAISAGLVALSAWGYAYHSDTFSPTLIGFFLTQPAFALLGLGSLIVRNRAAMDLSSRAMRAHVLAQMLIVVFAYLDLSSSSLYVRTRSPSDRTSSRFRLMPSMAMRFGPTHDPIDAGLAPGASLLTSVALGEAQLHAHDTEVGNLSSRMTHLVVFVVQAAAPILLALYAQYIVAHALGILARSANLSRRASSSSPSSRTGPATASRLSGERSKPPPRRSHAYTLPSLDVGELTSRLKGIEDVHGQAEDDLDDDRWDKVTPTSRRSKTVRLSILDTPKERGEAEKASSSMNTHLSPAAAALAKKMSPSHAHARSISQPILLPTQEAASEGMLLFTASPLAKTPSGESPSRATSPASVTSHGSAGVPVSTAGTEHWSAVQMALLEKGVRTGIQSPRRSASNVDQ